jgi:hypothetical protein
MKNLLSLSLIIVFSFLSCSKDDCTKDQFVGKWKGDYTCTVLGTGSDIVVDITSGSGSNLNFTETTTNSGLGFFNDVTLVHDDCEAEKDERILGTGPLFKAELKDGGATLVLTYSITGFGLQGEACTYTLKPE